jgi:thioredoxin reductase (NADPH)
MTVTTLLVVGGGIGGAATALRAAQYQIPTVWVLGDTSTHKASRAAYVKNIDNMIGIHPGIVQDKIVRLLRQHYPEAAERVELEHLHITTLDIVENTKARIRAEWADYVRFVEDRAIAAEKPVENFRLTLAGGETLEAPYLVLTTGVMDRQPVIHKQKGERVLAGIHWVFPYANEESLLYCIRCEGHLTPGRRVGVIGAGNAAAEIAMVIRERYDAEVTILTAGEAVTWSDRRAQLLDGYGVRVVGGHLVDVHGTARGKELHGFTVEGGERVDVELAFVSMGLHKVYNELARQLGAELEGDDGPPETRHAWVSARGETSVDNLFAVGDLAQRRDVRLMKQVYTAQEYAVRAVDTIDYRRRRAMRARLER